MHNTFKNILIGILLMIVSCTIVFVAGEIYFRLFKPQTIIPRYVETTSYGIRGLIGNVHGEITTPEFKHNFNTNSQGFRGKREYSFKKPSNIYRIIVLGDSVTMGLGVEDEETFSSVLEERLSRVRPTEVINMGVSGLGTAEELIKFRSVGLKYNPDLVILAYFPNDPYNNVVSKLFKIENGKLISDQKSFVPAIFIRDRLNKIPGYFFLSQHSHLINYIRNYFSGYFIRKLGKENNVDAFNPKILTQKERNLTAALINEVIAEVNDYKMPLIILNIPDLKLSRSVKKGELFSNLPTDLIKNTKSTYIIDVQKQIYGNYNVDEISYKIGEPKRLGHKLIGEQLAFFIKEKIWLQIK